MIKSNINVTKSSGGTISLNRYLMSYHKEDKGDDEFRALKLLILTYRMLCGNSAGRKLYSKYVKHNLKTE